MTLEEEVTIRVSKMTASVFKVFATAAFGASSYYALGLGELSLHARARLDL
jgi:hypothetical protein